MRAEREGRPYSGLVGNNPQHSDEENHLDAGEYEDEEDHEELLDFDMNSDANSQASSPETAETVIDFRELRPTTYFQIDLISMMLEPSRLQFFYMTGTAPPPRASSESYLTQYSQLQSALNSEIKNAKVEDYAGNLIGLVEWTSETWTWNGPWCLEAFGPEPCEDQVSRRVNAIMHFGVGTAEQENERSEISSRETSPDVKAVEEGPMETMVAGEMAIEDIESMDFSLPAMD